jgi:hypothetical protein
MMYTGIRLTLDDFTNEFQYEVFVEGVLVDRAVTRAKAEELLLLAKTAGTAKT